MATKRGNAFVATLFLAALAALALAGLASAKDLYLYEFEKSFNGADSNVGAMSNKVLRVAVNNENGRVYVLDQHNGKADITQFDENGTAALWSGLGGGTNSIELPGPLSTSGDLIFDNASGEHWGIFVLGEFGGGQGRAYNPDGTVRIPSFIKGFGGTCGLGMSRDGGLYVGGGQFANRFNPQNGAIIESGIEGSPWAEGAPCHNVWDLENNSWLPQDGEHGCFCEEARGLQKYGGPNEIFFKFPNFAKPNIVVQPGDANAPIKPVFGADIDEDNDNLFTIEDGRETQGPAQVLQVTDKGQPLLNFGSGTLHQSTGIAVNSNNHKVYVTSQTPTPHIDIFKRNPTPITVPDANTLPAGHPDGTSATLRAEIDPAGAGTTTDCRFDWGPQTNYGFGSLPCKVGGSETDNISSPAEVTNGVTSLTLGNQYHYRVATRNANGHWSFGADRLFEASTAPTTSPLLVEKINTDSGQFTLSVNPHGGTTKWRIEIGTQDCSLGGCEVISNGQGKLKSRLNAEQIQVIAPKLQPSTLYHVRLVAENGAGEVAPSLEFRTYPAPPTSDNCGNRAVRQQTGAALLLDCRAYELVSAANAGTYDVESDLVPLQTPFTAMPNAQDRVLYGLHYGTIPNIAGDPPNFGLDPYVAERTGSGWVTRYVGLPAEGMADHEAFGSPLLASDETLDSFAFGGEGICDPCFAGQGTNIPVRLGGAPAIPGMAGAFSGPSQPEGTVLKYMSADGSHLLFGSVHAFAADGDEGAFNLYSRNLGAATELVSTDDSGNPLSDSGLAGLDQSSDGSRVVVGEQIGDDGAGHPLYDLYLHRAGAPASTVLTPEPVSGPENGAIYNGMTADGSRAFFTTTDQLLGTDTDESADIYEAGVDTGGALSLRLISVKSDGQASNDDSCTPPGFPNTWNSALGDGKCGALAFAYGAGVASGDGTFYFLSPEQLEGGEGEAGQANLYVVRPGQSPHFVATIDSSAAKAPEPPPAHPLDDSSFSTVTGAEGMAVDGSNGDVYVVNGAGGKVTRLDGSGGADNFSAGPGSGTNVIEGFSFETPAGNAVAVDNSSSGSDPFKGYFYVTSKSGENAGVSVWKPTGEKAGQITGAGTSVGSFTSACGIAVDEADGSLYIGDKGGYIWRYRPTGSAPVTDADYTVTGVKTTTQTACAVAIQGQSVLATTFAEGAVKRYAKSSFAAGPLNQSGTEVTGKARALAIDPVTNELFVDEGNEIVIFGEGGEIIGTIENEGAWTGSRGVAINPTNEHLFVSAVSAGTIVEYGFERAEYTPIDNPGIVDAVNQPETHSYRDFQVTPDGRYAVFNTALALSPYSNNGHLEIYRYDTNGAGSYECATCAPTLAPAKNDTTLSPYGLNLTNDGRVFFTSREALVLSDTNEKLDAYQWNGGLEVGNISTGRGSFDSKLLSVSADGTDAFFFTRDVLVPTDENGGAVKIYDARAGGGYLQGSVKLACAASDECHGPGTPQPPPPDINSITGSGQQQTPEGKQKKPKCKKGFARKHKKCVKKHKPKRHHRKHRTGRNG